MNLYLLSLFIMVFSGCLGAFKKQPASSVDKVEEVVLAPGISLAWEKIFPLISSKDQIINLIGYPDFIDNHKTGEDWFYKHKRSVDFGLISFPSTGYLTNHAQYIKYPEWK